MSDHSHFGLFVGAFALMSLASVYGAEIMPAWLAPVAYADEVPVPGTIEPAGALSSFDSPRQLALPPGLPPMIATAPLHAYTPRNVLRPILAKAESTESLDDVANSERVAETQKGAATILPNAASCPSANPATRLAPAPAAHAESPIATASGPPLAPSGGGNPCPVAAPHTSVIAGASPAVVPAGPVAPPASPNAAPATP